MQIYVSCITHSIETQGPEAMQIYVTCITHSIETHGPDMSHVLHTV